ncbi:Transmembrane protein [Plasmodiophora brassicae]
MWSTAPCPGSCLTISSLCCMRRLGDRDEDQRVPLDQQQEIAGSRTIAMAWPTTVTLATLLTMACDASLQVVSPADGALLVDVPYVTADSIHTGIQSGDEADLLVANLTLFVGDPCNDAVAGGLQRQAVIVRDSQYYLSCTLEALAAHMVDMGAGAVFLDCGGGIQGTSAYYASDNSPTAMLATRRLPIMVLSLSTNEIDLMVAALADHPQARVRVQIDTNVWVAAFASPVYQLFVRVIPATIYLIAAALAVIYMVQRLRFVHADFLAKTIERRRSLKAACRYIVVHGLRIPDASLLLEFVSCTLNGVVIAVGGFCSTSNLPGGLVNFFLPQLAGASIAGDVLAAIVWQRMRNPSPSGANNWPMSRIATVSVMILLPIAIDTIVSLTFAVPGTGRALGRWMADNIAAIAGALFCLLQLVIGIHFLSQSTRFILETRSRRASLRGRGGLDASMDVMIARLARWTALLGVCQLVFVAITPIAVLPSFKTPPVWTAYWAVVGTSKAMSALCCVNMFKQRRKSHKVVQTSISKKPSLVPSAPST